MSKPRRIKVMTARMDLINGDRILISKFISIRSVLILINIYLKAH